MKFTYVRALFFMTTTISTIGYGDQSAIRGSDAQWELEMCYMMIVISGGIILFSSVTNEIFSFKRQPSVHEIVKQKSDEIEYFFLEISARVANRHLEDHIFRDGKRHVEQSVRQSTGLHFAKNEFFRELTPKL